MLIELVLLYLVCNVLLADLDSRPLIKVRKTNIIIISQHGLFCSK